MNMGKLRLFIAEHRKDFKLKTMPLYMDATIIATIYMRCRRIKKEYGLKKFPAGALITSYVLNDPENVEILLSLRSKLQEESERTGEPRQYNEFRELPRKPDVRK
jgi:hypothetical protein